MMHKAVRDHKRTQKSGFQSFLKHFTVDSFLKTEIKTTFCRISYRQYNAASVFGWQTLTDLFPEQWYSCDHYVGKLSTMGQLNRRPTLSFIPQGSVNEQKSM